MKGIGGSAACASNLDAQIRLSSLETVLHFLNFASKWWIFFIGLRIYLCRVIGQNNVHAKVKHEMFIKWRFCDWGRDSNPRPSHVLNFWGFRTAHAQLGPFKWPVPWSHLAGVISKLSGSRTRQIQGLYIKKKGMHCFSNHPMPTGLPQQTDHSLILTNFWH